MNTHSPTTPKSWREFAQQVRHRNLPLLARVDDFHRAILVTGCQRSGTTLLSNIITSSQGVKRIACDDDHEFMSALVLAGQRPLTQTPSDRFCFQTTYLNENYLEYFQMKGDHKIIWVLRNPHSVVYSMCYNWGSAALLELFLGCGASSLGGMNKLRFELIGRRGFDKLGMACHSYVGKVSQLFELCSRLPNKLFVIEYDQMTQYKQTLLPRVYDFIGLPYQSEYATRVHTKSLNKATLFSDKEADQISKICGPVYEKALSVVSTT